MFAQLFDDDPELLGDWRPHLNAPVARKQVESLMMTRPIPPARADLLAEALTALDVTRIAEPLRRVAAMSAAPFNNRAVATFCLFRANLDARFPSDRLADLAELLVFGAALAGELPSIQGVLAQIVSLPAVDAAGVAARLAKFARPYGMPGALVWATALTDARFQRVHGAILDHLDRDPQADALVEHGLQRGAIQADVAAAWRERAAPALAADDGRGAVYVFDMCPNCHGYQLQGLLPDGDGGWALVDGHVGTGHLDHARVYIGLNERDAEAIGEQLREGTYAIRVSWGALAHTAKDVVATDPEAIRMLSLIRAVSPATQGIGAVLEEVGWVPDLPGLSDLRQTAAQVEQKERLLMVACREALQADPAWAVAQLREVATDAEARRLPWSARAEPWWCEAYEEFADTIRAVEAAGLLDDGEALLDRVVVHDLRMALLWLARDPELLDEVDEDFRDMAWHHADTLERRGLTLADLLDGLRAPDAAVAWLERVLGVAVTEPLAKMPGLVIARDDD